jgi:predicted ABC-type ATPase
VPDNDVRRRYGRSLANLPEAIRIAHSATLFDNSENGQRKMLELRDGRITWSANEGADWVVGVRTDLDG